MQSFSVTLRDNMEIHHLTGVAGAPLILTVKTDIQETNYTGSIQDCDAWRNIGERHLESTFGGVSRTGSLRITRRVTERAPLPVDLETYPLARCKDTSEGQHLLYHFERLIHLLQTPDTVPPRPTWVPPPHPMLKPISTLIQMMLQDNITKQNVATWEQDQACTTRCSLLNAATPSSLYKVKIRLDVPLTDIDLDIHWGLPKITHARANSISRTYQSENCRTTQRRVQLVARNRTGPNQEVTLLRST